MVVPIGVIVAVAIVCVVVAVLSSAQRADVVAVDNERQMFSRALSNYGERVLREAESVASSDGAIQHIRQSFNYDWVNQRVGAWLTPVIDFMRGRDQHPRGAIRLNQMNPPDTGKLP